MNIRVSRLLKTWLIAIVSWHHLISYNVREGPLNLTLQGRSGSRFCTEGGRGGEGENASSFNTGSEPGKYRKIKCDVKNCRHYLFFFWHHPYFFRYGFCLVQASSQQVWVWSYKTFYKRFDRKSENSTLPPLRKTELKWCVLTQTLPHFPRWSPDVQLQKYLKGFVTDSSRK